LGLLWLIFPRVWVHGKNGFEFAVFGFWEKYKGLGLLCMGCLAKRGGSAGKEW